MADIGVPFDVAEKILGHKLMSVLLHHHLVSVERWHKH
jgi:intergrase/recombinase